MLGPRYHQIGTEPTSRRAWLPLKVAAGLAVAALSLVGLVHVAHVSAPRTVDLALVDRHLASIGFPVAPVPAQPDFLAGAWAAYDRASPHVYGVAAAPAPVAVAAAAPVRMQTPPLFNGGAAPAYYMNARQPVNANAVAPMY